LNNNISITIIIIMSFYTRTIDDVDLFRNKIKLSLNNIINNINISDNLEKGIYNYSLEQCDKRNIIKKWNNSQFVIIYIEKFKMILTNIKSKNVLYDLKNKKYKAHNLAFMTHQEICPDKWHQLIEDKKIRDDNKFKPKIEASTDDFTCFKCKSKKCSYYQLQTRSADEPMTTFVSCLECGNRWKF